MEININFNSHGLRWHTCNAIAKGIAAELTAKDGKQYDVEGIRAMVNSIPTRRLFILYPKFVWLHPAQRLVYHGHTSRRLPGKKVL